MYSNGNGGSRCLSRASAIVVLGLALFCGCQETKPELPTLGHVPSFELTDQEGHAFTPQQLQGRPWVAAFMFTRCPSVCPRITRVMQGLQTRAKADGTDIHWVSFSVDPGNDTPAVLKSYAEEFHADLNSWSFLTGPLEKIRETSEQGFKVAFEGSPKEGAEHLGITHGSHLILVDRSMNIRGYYRTLDDDAQQRLLADAKALR